jgi:hypothetical protein
MICESDQKCHACYVACNALEQIHLFVVEPQQSIDPMIINEPHILKNIAISFTNRTIVFCISAMRRTSAGWCSGIAGVYAGVGAFVVVDVVVSLTTAATDVESTWPHPSDDADA